MRSLAVSVRTASFSFLSWISSPSPLCSFQMEKRDIKQVNHIINPLKWPGEEEGEYPTL